MPSTSHKIKVLMCCGMKTTRDTILPFNGVVVQWGSQGLPRWASRPSGGPKWKIRKIHRNSTKKNWGMWKSCPSRYVWLQLWVSGSLLITHLETWQSLTKHTHGLCASMSCTLCAFHKCSSSYSDHRWCRWPVYQIDKLFCPQENLNTPHWGKCWWCQDFRPTSKNSAGVAYQSHHSWVKINNTVFVDFLPSP